MGYIEKKYKSFIDIMNEEENIVKKLLKNKNFRNNQNYIFKKGLKVKLVWSLWHTIVNWNKKRVIWWNKNFWFVYLKDLNFFKSSKWQFMIIFLFFLFFLWYQFFLNPDVWLLFALCFICLWWYLIFGLKYFLVWKYIVGQDRDKLVYSVKNKGVKILRNKNINKDKKYWYSEKINKEYFNWFIKVSYDKKEK